MRIKSLYVAAVAVLVVVSGFLTFRAPASFENLALIKIHRCTVENFMMEHRILYHVNPSRYDMASLNMLCLRASNIQADLIARN